MNATATPRTETLNWFNTKRTKRDLLAQVLGRRAVYTTANGTKMIGTITGTDREDWYLVVTFDDGRWGRLDKVITLIREDA